MLRLLMTPKDETSTKVRVIACGMIAREVLAINEQLGSDHIDLKCLPANYHHFPKKIAPALDVALQEAKNEGFENIFVGYADCGSGGEIDKICDKHGVSRIEGPHCFSFYMGNDQFEKEVEQNMTTFYITDFLARHFDTFMLQPLGMDKHPELIEMYFGNYEKALYLAQTKDAELEENAKKAAEILGLKYEYRYTGFGDLIPALEELVDHS